MRYGRKPTSPPTDPSAVRRPSRRRARPHRLERPQRLRRANGLPGTLGVTLLGALLPGAGFVYAGRRLLGALILVPALGLLLGGAWYVGRDLAAVTDFVFSPRRLRAAAVVLVAGLAVWALVVLLTYRQVRPTIRKRWHTVAGHAFVLTLVVVVGAPFAVAARYATVQSELVETVFDDNITATLPVVEATEEDPWGGRERVNVLLLGGDGSEGRSGVRTDTVILVSVATATGRTVMFSLPRNMMNAQFPETSPLHEHYPDGFTAPGDPAEGMLNAIYGTVPALYPRVLGESSDEGADAIKQAVSGSLGIPVDYYVLADLQGFEGLVDAIGGITVNINQPVAIQGNTDLGIPPVDYLDPGPDQHLDGFEALWFARGRYGSDDYARMERQRCAVAAIIEAADPITLVGRYTQLASAGQEMVSTDIPRELMPAFVELGLRVKDAKVRSVVFRNSEAFFSGAPDFEWLRDTVARAIDPPAKRRPRGDPARPELAEDTCAYAPPDED